MPCLNEERTLPSCIRKAKALIDGLECDGEIIVADNGSVDASRDVAKNMGARVVDVEEPGYGSAIRGGLSAAQGSYLIVGDADDSYDFCEADAMIRNLQSGECDMVIGSRTRGTIHKGAMPWMHRYVGTPLLTTLLNRVHGASFTDVNCGLRALSRGAYERMNLASAGMELASEMLIAAHLLGMRIKEVPVSLHPDGRDRPPHLRPIKDGIRHARLIMALR